MEKSIKSTKKEFEERFGDFTVRDNGIKLKIADAVFVTDGKSAVWSFISSHLSKQREEGKMEGYMIAYSNLKGAGVLAKQRSELIKEIEKEVMKRKRTYEGLYDAAPAYSEAFFEVMSILSSLKERKK